ncbi:Cytochrome P450 4V2 [Araneus ventricosus]|uniref:Cytochrome P450 4V2 n=1 Tax=Araneus ventricosus TaxID=182803 RepID=A0A4Y2K1N2_ARAVE|nr:Cytochrome P450 4V2 [Araneus ventricosus]
MPGRKHNFFNIFGDLTEFDLMKDSAIQVFDVVGKTLNYFPKEQLVCVWLSYSPLVLVVKANAVREILKENKMTEKSFQYQWIKPHFGTGLVISQGGKWKSRRRLFNPCFHPDMLRCYLDKFNYTSQKLVKVLQEESRKDFVEILDPLTLCALALIFETIFGTKIGALENIDIQFSNSVKRIMSTIIVRAYSVWLWPEFIFWNTKTGKDFEYHVNVVQEFTKNLNLSLVALSDEGRFEMIMIDAECKRNAELAAEDYKQRFRILGILLGSVFTEWFSDCKPQDPYIPKEDRRGRGVTQSIYKLIY